MSRTTRVAATIKHTDPDGETMFQVYIDVANGYPDALDEARCQAVRAVKELAKGDYLKTKEASE